MNILFLKSFTLFLLLFITVLVNAQTNVSGFISTNTTWDINGSPYIIVGNALVSQGITLTINPDVVVKFDSAKALQIDGELIAIGAPDIPITFTSNQSTPHAGDWSEIHFSNLCTSATFDGNGNYLSGSIMKFCNVLYGGDLGYGQVHIESSSPYFSQCNILNSSNDGIYCFGSSYLIDSSMVKNCTGIGLSFYSIQTTSCGLKIVGDSIEDNTKGGVYIDSNPGCTTTFNKDYFYGNSSLGAIYFYEGGTNVNITDNSFINNLGSTIQNNLGSTILTVYGANVEISENYFQGNSSTGLNNSILYIGCANGSVNCNRFISNLIGQNGLGCINSLPQNLSISSNIFEDNINNSTYGVVVSNIEGQTATITTTNEFSNNTIINNSAPSGIICKFLPAFYRYNIFPIMIIDSNNFTNNTAKDVIYMTPPQFDSISNLHFQFNNLSDPNAQYEFYNDFPYGYPDLHVDSNYWGSTSTQHVDSAIYDYFDDATKSVVYYTPILTASVTVDTSCAPSSNSGIPSIPQQTTSAIFPNPFSDYAVIRFNKSLNHATLRVYNVYGQIVKTIAPLDGSKILLNRDQLPSGFYIYEIIENQQRVTVGKMVVE
jgi:hypothetical protein